MVCGESAERYDDAGTRKSFGCFAGAWWNAGHVGRADYYGKSSSNATSARKPFVFSDDFRRILAVCVFSLTPRAVKNTERVFESFSSCLRRNFHSLREILPLIAQERRRHRSRLTSTVFFASSFPSTSKTFDSQKVLVPKALPASRVSRLLVLASSVFWLFFPRPPWFPVADFCAIGLSGVRITHPNTRWARSTVPSLVPVRFAVRPPRSPSRTRRSSPRVAPSSVSRYAESPLRFRALGSIAASPGTSPIATLTPPVLLPDRQQYNRRFVNVVVGLGKKRSPNSNAT